MLQGRACHSDRTRSAASGLKTMPSSFGFHRMSSSYAKGCHHQGWRHLHARSLVSDPEYLLIACLLFACTNFHVLFTIAAPTHANEKKSPYLLTTLIPNPTGLSTNIQLQLSRWLHYRSPGSLGYLPRQRGVAVSPSPYQVNSLSALFTGAPVYHVNSNHV